MCVGPLAEEAQPLRRFSYPTHGKYFVLLDGSYAPGSKKERPQKRAPAVIALTHGLRLRTVPNGSYRYAAERLPSIWPIGVAMSPVSSAVPVAALILVFVLVILVAVLPVFILVVILVVFFVIADLDDVGRLDLLRGQRGGCPRRR